MDIVSIAGWTVHFGKSWNDILSPLSCYFPTNDCGLPLSGSIWCLVLMENMAVAHRCNYYSMIVCKLEYIERLHFASFAVRSGSTALRRSQPLEFTQQRCEMLAVNLTVVLYDYYVTYLRISQQHMPLQR